jgi:uncharacterized protein (TIGR02328 family)
MRLWDFRLLPFLDDFHIVAQWRELLAIKGAIDKNRTPNHRLVNKVLDYNIQEFKNYTALIISQLRQRNIKYLNSKWEEIRDWECEHFDNDRYFGAKLYEGWHNNRYLTQCYYNLQEKADCGIVSKQAWSRIDEFYKKEMGNGKY